MIKMFILALALFASCTALSDTTQFAFEYSKKMLAAYEIKVGDCQNQAKQNTQLTQAELNLIRDFSFSPFIIPYLEKQAFNRCVMEQKALFFEALLTLEQANKLSKNNKISEFIEEQKSINFRVSSLTTVEGYMKLPQELRATFESIDSLQKPFNGILMLEAIWQF